MNASILPEALRENVSVPWLGVFVRRCLRRGPAYADSLYSEAIGWADCCRVPSQCPRCARCLGLGSGARGDERPLCTERPGLTRGRLGAGGNGRGPETSFGRTAEDDGGRASPGRAGPEIPLSSFFLSTFENSFYSTLVFFL